jgi:hypothetical protein
MDCTSPPDFFETPGSSSSPVHLDSVAAVVEADVQNQKSPYEYEQYLEDALETGDTHSWTQVVGNRKKFKKSSRSGVNPDAPPINVSPRFARRVNNSRGDGKVGTALGIAPSSALRVRVIPVVNEPFCSHENRHTHLLYC